MSDPARNTRRKPVSVRELIQTGTPQDPATAGDGGSFSDLLSHARALNRLDGKLANILDANLSIHCRVAEFHHRRLILICSDAAIATRIRMQTPQLIEALAAAGETGIEQIDIRIAPLNRPRPETRKPKIPSSAALQALGRFATDSGDARIQAVFDKIKARRNGQ